MPALAIMVMSAMTIPRCLSQYASVPATSKKGRPDEKPKNSIVHAAGVAKARHNDGLCTATAPSIGIVDRVRRVVGKPRRRRDRAGLELRAQTRRDDLVVDA